MTDSERKALEKEIKGLKARLNWDHISGSQRDAYEARIAEIEAMFKPAEQTTPTGG